MGASSYEDPCVYGDIYKDVVIRGGLMDPTDSTGATVNRNSPYVEETLKRWICQADTAIYNAILETPDHPYQTAIDSYQTVSMNDGERIPANVGNHVKVIDSNGNPARLAQSFDHIRRWQNRSIQLPMYWIENRLLYTCPAGSNFSIVIPDPTYANPADSPPTLLSPQKYHNGLVAYALGLMILPGTDLQHRAAWAEIGNDILKQVRMKVSTIPLPERAQRISD